jgi:hypothetical protein
VDASTLQHCHEVNVLFYIVPQEPTRKNAQLPN